MRVAIVGSRTFNLYDLVKEKMQGRSATEIVSGGATGADKLGELYAFENNIPFKPFLADWQNYGKRAGFMRNVEIVDYSDIVLCFWDGVSKGTRHDIELCIEKQKPCEVFMHWTPIPDFDWSDRNPMFKALADSKRPKLVIG